MSDNIKVLEKPDGVSWDAIKDCLTTSHAENRERGIRMSHYRMTPEKIASIIGDRGVLIIAMDGNKVVGTAGISEREYHTWYAKGIVGYLCFDAILPDYRGRGIFQRMDKMRNDIICQRQYHTLLFDTHYRNRKRIEMALSKGYRKVWLFVSADKDHYSVVVARWLSGSVPSNFKCQFHFVIRAMKVLISTRLRYL